MKEGRDSVLGKAPCRRAEDVLHLCAPRPQPQESPRLHVASALRSRRVSGACRTRAASPQQRFSVLAAVAHFCSLPTGPDGREAGGSVAHLLLAPSGSVFPKAPQPWGPRPESPQPGTETGASTGGGPRDSRVKAPWAARSPQTGQASSNAGACAAGLRQALSIASPFVRVPRRRYRASWSRSCSSVPTVEGRPHKERGRTALRGDERGAESALGPLRASGPALGRRPLGDTIRLRAGRRLRRRVSEDLRPGGSPAGCQVCGARGTVRAAASVDQKGASSGRLLKRDTGRMGTGSAASSKAFLESHFHLFVID